MVAVMVAILKMRTFSDVVLISCSTVDIIQPDWSPANAKLYFGGYSDDACIVELATHHAPFVP